MPRGGKKQKANTDQQVSSNKTTPEVEETAETSVNATETACPIIVDRDEDGDPDFSPSFSNESLTWMRKVMRVQAADVLKCEKRSGETIGKKTFQELEKKFEELVSHMKLEIDSLASKMKQQVSDLEAKITNLEAENDQKSKQIRRMEFQQGKDKSKIKELMITVDELQQNQHKSSIQLVGLPESNSEEADMKKFVQFARDKIGVKLKNSDVPEIYRLGKKSDKKTRDLVIKFSNQKTRDTFHTKRKKAAPHKDPAKNIYVNDVLTTYRKGLFYAARKLYKGKKLCAAWTQQGNVLVRKTEGDKAMEIKCYDDLVPFRDGNCNYSITYSEPDATSSLDDNDGMSQLSGFSY